MADMDTVTCVLLCHRLRQRTKPSLGRIESTEARTSPERRACTREQQRACAFRNHAADGFPPEQEAAEAYNAPALLEIAGFHIDDLAWRIVARVVDCQFEVAACLVEQRDNIGFAGRVRNHGKRTPTRGDDIGHDGIERRLGPAGDENIEALSCKTLAELRAKALIRPDTDDDCRSHASRSRND
jgi:hypothetical protein